MSNINSAKSYIRGVQDTLRTVGLDLVSNTDDWANGDGVVPKYWHDKAIADAKITKNTDILKLDNPANGYEILSVGFAGIRATAKLKGNEIEIRQGNNIQLVKKADRNLMRTAVRMVMDYLNEAVERATK